MIIRQEDIRPPRKNPTKKQRRYMRKSREAGKRVVGKMIWDVLKRLIDKSPP